MLFRNAGPDDRSTDSSSSRQSSLDWIATGSVDDGVMPAAESEAPPAPAIIFTPEENEPLPPLSPPPPFPAEPPSTTVDRPSFIDSLQSDRNNSHAFLWCCVGHIPVPPLDEAAAAATAAAAETIDTAAASPPFALSSSSVFTFSAKALWSLHIVAVM